MSFGVDPSMFCITSRNKGYCATVDTEYLVSKVFTFCDLCCLQFFCDSVQLKFVGCVCVYIYDSQKILSDVSLALSKLKRVYIVRGKKITLTPDDLFGSFTVFSPLLSSNAMSWYFLVTLFSYATPLELQKTVKLGGYGFPDISTLITSLLQEQALQTLRVHAVISFNLLLRRTVVSVESCPPLLTTVYLH